MRSYKFLLLASLLLPGQLGLGQGKVKVKTKTAAQASRPAPVDALPWSQRMADSFMKLYADSIPPERNRAAPGATSTA